MGHTVNVFYFSLAWSGIKKGAAIATPVDFPLRYSVLVKWTI